MSRYKYTGGKSYKSKKSYPQAREQNYLRSYNLNLESISPGSILAMQNKIGNEATEELLKYVAHIAPGGKGCKLIFSGSSQSGYDDDMETMSQMASEFRDIAKDQKNAYSDTVSDLIGPSADDESRRLKLKGEEISYLLRKLEETALALKDSNVSEGEKELQTALGDLMLTAAGKEKQAGADSILNMIMHLDKYDGTKRSKYMSVLNMLCSTGVDVMKLLSLAGHVDKQRMLLYDAVGAFDKEL